MSGIEPSFGVNTFNQAKFKNETQAVANDILALLFGKPGYFPSMPDLGINIQDTVYMFWDDIDETALKALIASQCEEFSEYINDGSLDVIKSSYNNQPLLLIVIPVQIQYKKENLAIGITTDENGNFQYNYVYQEDEE